MSGALVMGHSDSVAAPAADQEQTIPVNILVVDDRPENLLAVSTLLEAPGRRLVQAASGREALRALLRDDFAVVLLDLNMPEMDGFETAQLIRRRPRSAQTPLIFVTAHRDEAFVARAYQMGAVDYISTPVEPTVLRAKVAVFVELFRKTEENRRQAEQLHRAEERLRRQAEERLREADERLRLVVDSVSDYAIFSLDPAGRIASWNAGATRLFLYDAAEVVGRDPVMLLAAGPAADAAASLWEMAREAGRGECDRWFRRKDGTRFYATDSVTVMRDSSGATLGYSKVVHDITARREAEEALVQKAEQLSQANRVKDEFLAVLSHELRTPLNAIIGWTHLLQKAGLDSEMAEQALEVIARNGRMQLALINDILDVSRFVTGKMRLAMAATDLRAIATAAVDGARPAADAKEIALEVHLGEEPLVVNADGERLQQAIWNLVANAIKFTPRGGRVEVAAAREAATVVLTVEDNGIGIPAAFLPHLFERFRQADSSTGRAHGGLGLGLSIVRHLVELHGGTARAESEGAGLGARFVITLPAAARLAEASARGETPTLVDPDAAVEDHPSPTGRLPGLRCLVVDDEADARDLLKTALEQRGVLVTLARSAQEALDLVADSDVLLSDIGMPGEDGYSLIQRVRALPSERGGRIPAIALTAYASVKDRDAAIRAGFQRHLSKPIEFRVLLETVEDVLRTASPATSGSPGATGN